MWTEVNHWMAPLYPFLQRKAYSHLGCDTGQDVYIIWCGDDAVYVGKTLTGAWNRIWQHVKTNTNLGAWIVEHEFDTSAAAQVEVIGVSGDIDKAEQHTISACGPKLNIVNYKNNVAMPPLDYVEPEIIDVHDVPFLTSIFKAPTSAGVVGSPAYFAGKSLYKLDMLYERAYRDPNHPEMREMAVQYATPSTSQDVFYYLRTRRLRDSE